MNQEREIVKTTAKTKKYEPYNLSEDFHERQQQQMDAFWRKQWDEILYPDWT